MIACGILTGLGIICVIWYVIEKIKGYNLKEVIIKTAASLFFISVGLIATNGKGISGIFIMLGLIFGLLGDIWLDLKYVYKEHDKIYSYVGFISFGIGHIFFCIGLFNQFYFKSNILFIILPIIACLIISGLTIGLEKVMKLKYGDMKLITFLYALCLFSTVSFSGSFVVLHSFKNVSIILFFIGAVSFAISDLILSGTYFGEGKEKPINFILNYLFYYGAQFLIALSFLFL